MFVEDVDGDGDGDVITSLNGHGYGLAWYEQNAAGFERHDVAGYMSLCQTGLVRYDDPA